MHGIARTLIFLVCFAGLADGATASGVDRPNVVILISDDQGYGDLSAHGNPYLKTPNLDRLKAQSVSLEDFHVFPACTPTRSALLTGLDPLRNAAYAVTAGRYFMRRDIPTLAEVFRDNGYQTGHFGKWHLGANYPHRPLDRGFDTSVGHHGWGVGSISDYWNNDYFDDHYYRDGAQEAFEGYCDDIWFDETMAFMRRSKAKDKPFFAYLATNVAHFPFYAPEEDRLALAPLTLTGQAATIPNDINGILAMLERLDGNVGRLMAFLKDEGLEENTIFIFMTDNGAAQSGFVYNAGMRGLKITLEEGGHRVPCFIRWPKGDIGEGVEIDSLTIVQDLAPTLSEWCDLRLPEDIAFDGDSLDGMVRGMEESALEDRIAVVQYGPGNKYNAALLWKRWRLIRNSELYNLEEDPLQQNNIIDENPELVRRLRDYYEDWYVEVQPHIAPWQRIVVGNPAESPSKLSSESWIHQNVSQQNHVRTVHMPSGTWKLEVERSGDYRITLRRYPVEANLPIGTAIPAHEPFDRYPSELLPNFYPAGKAVDATTAVVLVDGNRKSAPVQEGAKHGEMIVHLPAGETDFSAHFEDASGDISSPAYYVELEIL